MKISYIKWFFLTIISYTVTVIGLILVPLVVPFAKDGHLPKLFWWLETYDNPLTGDKSHEARWAWVRKFFRRINHDKIGWYLQVVGWLWRNKSYNFDYYILGADIPTPIPVSKGDINVRSDSNTPHYGWYYAESSNGYWCLWGFHPYLKIGNYALTVRVFCGWKFKSTKYLKDSGTQHCMLAVHCNPFRLSKWKNEK